MSRLSKIYAGYDLAYPGADAAVLVETRGGVIVNVESASKFSLPEMITKIKTYITEHANESNRNDG